jgi:hypothetical protein
MSSLPVGSEEELRHRPAWYALRWPMAEEFHQVEKTRCGEEQLRFETAEAMGPKVALLSLVAVRLVQLRDGERHRPEAPAALVASPDERAVVAARAPGELSAEGMTVRQFVRGVARLGGFPRPARRRVAGLEDVGAGLPATAGHGRGRAARSRHDPGPDHRQHMEATT